MFSALTFGGPSSKVALPLATSVYSLSLCFAQGLQSAVERSQPSASAGALRSAVEPFQNLCDFSILLVSRHHFLSTIFFAVDTYSQSAFSELAEIMRVLVQSLHIESSNVELWNREFQSCAQRSSVGLQQAKKDVRGSLAGASQPLTLESLQAWSADLAAVQAAAQNLHIEGESMLSGLAGLAQDM